MKGWLLDTNIISESQPDLFIAATAVRHDLCVVTRNVTDFEMSGVPVFNPSNDLVL